MSPYYFAFRGVDVQCLTAEALLQKEALIGHPNRGNTVVLLNCRSEVKGSRPRLKDWGGSVAGGSRMGVGFSMGGGTLTGPCGSGISGGDGTGFSGIGIVGGGGGVISA